MAEVELPKPDELHEHAATLQRRVALVTAIYAVAWPSRPSAATTR
jgi:hypothetical protein